MDKGQPPHSLGTPAFHRWERATPLTEEEAEARLHQEGYSSFRWYDVPGTLYPRHWHESDEVIWVLSGEIHFTVGNETFTLQKGDRLDLPAKTPHIAKVPDSGGVTYIVGKKGVEVSP